MKPFLLGKKTVESVLLRTPHGHTSSGLGAVRPAQPGANVEVVKQGDKVVRLIVTCACGEKIEVECLYPAGN